MGAVLPYRKKVKRSQQTVWEQIMEKWGYGLSRGEAINIVGQYVTCNKIKTPFCDNTPGEDWFLSFKKRHCLSLKKQKQWSMQCNKYFVALIISKTLSSQKNL